MSQNKTAQFAVACLPTSVDNLFRRLDKRRNSMRLCASMRVIRERPSLKLRKKRE